MTNRCFKMQVWVYAWRYQTNSNIYIGGLADESNAGKQKGKKIPQKNTITLVRIHIVSVYDTMQLR